MSEPSMQHAGVGGPYMEPKSQPLRLRLSFPAKFATNWDAYDVPRLWDSIRHDNDPHDWEQAEGFDYLTSLLKSQCEQLSRLRDDLAIGWDPRRNTAASAFFGFLDDLVHSMQSDAVDHAASFQGLARILETLAAAKEKVAGLKQDWDDITTIHHGTATEDRPDGAASTSDVWDMAADNLNQKARQIMRDADTAIAADRKTITVPFTYSLTTGRRLLEGESTHPPGTDPEMSGDWPDAPSRSSGAGQVRTPPPPIPGTQPILDPRPDLSGVPGVPQPMPAVPGTPISALPVPPGHPLAPSGGAYVLPGPGVGRGGWIQPAPRPDTTGQTRIGGTRTGGGRIAATGQLRPGAGAGSSAMAPMPFGAAGSPQRAGGAGGNRYRSRNGVVWEIAQGVPPVIGQNPERQPAEHADHADTDFTDWFRETATPWSSDLNVTFTRKAEESR